jgi:UMF1 family MFS transporter
MTLPIHFWILGVAVSVVLGVPSALARSIFARLIPIGRQTEYFSFFAISGKMTSLFGPLMFAIISDVADDGRFSILSLSIFFIIGLVLLRFVSVDQPKVARID